MSLNCTLIYSVLVVLNYDNAINENGGDGKSISKPRIKRDHRDEIESWKGKYRTNHLIFFSSIGKYYYLNVDYE